MVHLEKCAKSSFLGLEIAIAQPCQLILTELLRCSSWGPHRHALGKACFWSLSSGALYPGPGSLRLNFLHKAR